MHPPNVVRIQLRGAAGLVRAQTTRIPNGEGEGDIAGPSRVSCNAVLGIAIGHLLSCTPAMLAVVDNGEEPRGDDTATGVAEVRVRRGGRGTDRSKLEHAVLDGNDARMHRCLVDRTEVRVGVAPVCRGEREQGHGADERTEDKLEKP